MSSSAAGFTRTQFVKKCAAGVNKIAHGSLMMVMLGYVLVTALLAQFIQSSVIVFGIMAPMMIAACEEMKISPSKTPFPLSIVSIATIHARLNCFSSCFFVISMATGRPWGQYFTAPDMTSRAASSSSWAPLRQPPLMAALQAMVCISSSRAEAGSAAPVNLSRLASSDRAGSMSPASR